MDLESLGKRFDVLLSPLIRLSRNWISRAGVFIVTAATVFFLFLLPSLFSGAVTHPYLGILHFVVLPLIFVLGLLLIPLGLYVDRKRGGNPVLEPAERTWSHPMLRQLVVFIGIATAINIMVFSQLSYRAVHFMDSTQFCGTACHQVMQPEYTAYQNAAHSHVDCVQCHIGPGAEWELRAKISGTRQLFKVLFNSYSRPTPAPVHNLRPANDTCGACHFPGKTFGDRVKVFSKYGEDETNTLTKSVLLLRIGGGRQKTGIHGAHLADGVKIRFRPGDEKRQTIPWVERAKPGEATTVYIATGADPSALEKLPMRDMDCTDCHNRPAHNYEMPEAALDRAMDDGRIDPALPFAKKTGLALLKKGYPAGGEGEIATAFRAFYQSKYPDLLAAKKVTIDAAAANLLAIYRRNIFPEMNVGWGTYPNHLGHMDFPGCFRCHDDDHKSADGKKVIGQDCSACHELVASDEKNPKVLADLGLQK